ncbi:hypothetical protein [Galactobacter sp.]|uniref:hypothetical protein n=1 Tax=Galactobacter sp. TaxID=2676125 RepID=UPI0025BBC8EC|nr:hypothetical protein [Galactobacter sp.]
MKTVAGASTRAKSKSLKWGAAGAIAAVALGTGALIAPAANADTIELTKYDESDSANPLEVTGGLVYYKGADMGWLIGPSEAEGVDLSEVKSLAYTVDASGTAPKNETAKTAAPFFQLISSATKPGVDLSYARLTWVPDQKNGVDPHSGVYTDLQNGVWGTNKIKNGKGSLSDPQPLSFFTDENGAGWSNVEVKAIAVQQGTTTESTSLVSKIVYNGDEVELGSEDATPYDQADVDKAVADAEKPLKDENADLQAKLDKANADLKAYKKSHTVANGTGLGYSRAVMSQPKAGKAAKVTMNGTLARSTSLEYQWYLNDKAVKGATKSTYTIPKSAKGKKASVRVLGTYKTLRIGVRSNTELIK